MPHVTRWDPLGDRWCRSSSSAPVASPNDTHCPVPVDHQRGVHFIPPAVCIVLLQMLCSMIATPPLAGFQGLDRVVVASRLLAADGCVVQLSRHPWLPNRGVRLASLRTASTGTAVPAPPSPRSRIAHFKLRVPNSRSCGKLSQLLPAQPRCSTLFEQQHGGVVRAPSAPVHRQNSVPRNCFLAITWEAPQFTKVQRCPLNLQLSLPWRVTHLLLRRSVGGTFLRRLTGQPCPFLSSSDLSFLWHCIHRWHFRVRMLVDKNLFRQKICRSCIKTI